MISFDIHYIVRYIREHKFLFFTYLIMLFVPFIAFIFCLFSADSIMRKDALQYQNSILQHEKSICDNMIHNTKIAINTASLETNAKLLQNEAYFSPESLLTVSKLSANLADIKRNYPYIDSLGIYFCKNDSFVTDVKRYAPAIYKSYLNKYNLSIEEFCSSTTKPNGYILLTGGNENYILIYQDMFDYSLKKTSAVAYGIISWDAFQNQLGYYKSIEGEAFFLLNHNNSLFGCSDNFISTEELPDYEAMSAQSALNANQLFFSADNDALISGVPSDELNIFYGTYLKKNEFYHAINLLLFKYSTGLAGSILIGICLSFYFTKKNSAPINHLLSIIENNRNKNPDVVLPENYGRLENALTTILKDNRRLAHQLYLQEESLSETTLSGFLKGIYPNEDWILEFHDNHPALREIKDYRIVLFCFSNIETCKFIREQKESMESYSLLFFSLKNVIDEAFLKNDEVTTNGLSIVSDSMVICIIPASEENYTEDQLITNAQDCIHFFQRVFELDSCITVSNIHSLWTELPEAYEEAYMTTSHVSFWENGSIVSFYQTESDNILPNGSQLLQLKKKLSNSLIANNYDVAKELITEILNHYFPHGIQYFSYNQCQAHALTSMLLDKLNDLGLDDETKEDYTTRLLHANSIGELKNEISAVFDELLVSQSQTDSDDSWAESVKQYIRDNSANVELSVAYIAEHFSISAAHLGNRFRKLNGIGVLDYIHMVRLAKCKELLEQGYAIKDCVGMTGYTDIKTLQRAFKRYEGITPGQYKETVINQKQLH